MEVSSDLAALCEAYLDYFFKLAFEEGEKKGVRKAETISFTLTRTVINNGEPKPVEVQVDAPLLAPAEPGPAKKTPLYPVQQKRAQCALTSNKCMETSHIGAFFCMGRDAS